MHFKINLALLPPYEPKFLHQIVDDSRGANYIDCLGQILQQMGLNLLPKNEPVRNLNELSKPAGIFTRCVRGKHVQTDIASQIMQVHPLSPENMKVVAALLVPHHTIEFIDKTGNTVFSSFQPTQPIISLAGGE